ncbi:MAG: PHP domain-containing protein [Lachnospiraceae bacterium]
MKKIDLHVHSTASDGTYTPEELVELAKIKDLAAFALTDHDTTAGINAASKAAEGTGIELIPGVELSCDFEGTEIHMVGLFIDPNDEKLNTVLADFRDNRDNRNVKMIENLKNEGFPIELDAIAAEFPDCVLTRAHIARYLVNHQLVKDMETVFSTYIGDGCRCYVAREKITPFDAISLIHDAGGLAILAHPLLYHLNTDRLKKLVKDLTESGLDGMEAVYSTFSPNDMKNMKELARENNLLVSGGSDFHGSNKPYIQLGSGRGSLFVPYSLLEKMKERLSK